jgi:hypothetical protein
MTRTPSAVAADPVLVVADCRRALEKLEREAEGRPTRRALERADRAFDQREKLVRRMIVTPALSLPGVIAKLEEVFPLTPAYAPAWRNGRLTLPLTSSSGSQRFQQSAFDPAPFGA